MTSIKNIGNWEVGLPHGTKQVLAALMKAGQLKDTSIMQNTRPQITFKIKLSGPFPFQNMSSHIILHHDLKWLGVQLIALNIFIAS